MKKVFIPKKFNKNFFKKYEVRLQPIYTNTCLKVVVELDQANSIT